MAKHKANLHQIEHAGKFLSGVIDVRFVGYSGYFRGVAVNDNDLPRALQMKRSLTIIACAALAVLIALFLH